MQIEKECLYRYPNSQGWCKHGIVYTMERDGKMYAIDTYWDSTFKHGLYQDTTYYNADSICNDLEFVMKLEDIKEVGQDEYFLYDKKDRIHLPIGGWHERYLVNKNAEKRQDYIIADLQEKIRSAKSQIKWLQNDIKEWEEELTKITIDV